MSEKRAAKVDEKKKQAIRACAEDPSSMAGALAAFAFNFWDRRIFQLLPERYGKPMALLSRDEFLSRELMDAFASLAGKDMADKLPELVNLRLEGQFSSSMHRRSYRSQRFGLYVEEIIQLMRGLLHQSCCIESVQERLYCKEDWNTGFDYLLALEIRHDNREIIALLHDAIMGDNSDILLTRPIINAIIISGHDGLLDDLMKLLLAAKMQEGLRQHILEAADMGRTDVLRRILKVCIDENLFRFSSVIRLLIHGAAWVSATRSRR